MLALNCWESSFYPCRGKARQMFWGTWPQKATCKDEVNKFNSVNILKGTRCTAKATAEKRERGNSFSSRKHILNRRQHQHKTGPAGITSQHCNQTHKIETSTPEYQGLGSATPAVLSSSAKNRAGEGWKAENRDSMFADWKEGWVKGFGDPNFMSKALIWALGLD